jgi:radical SAM/Cys-rich protein
VGALREDGHQVQLRTNLSALDEPGHEDLPGFLRGHEVRLAASLPCYTSENVRAQRGDGVFEKSVSVLRKLNGLGYGTGLGPALTLVYNPGGPFLPGDQAGLEADYRRELRGRFGIEFSGLFTIANMPLGRFRNALREEGGLRAYTRLLAEGFNDRTVDQLMCRHQISVAWDGALYDCDFNLALGLPVAEGLPSHVSGLDAGRFEARPIRTGVHCFACTAGAGSSCGGALDRGAN